MRSKTILSKRLKEIREYLNLTQKEFVDGTSINPPTLSAYETGVSSPSIIALMELVTKHNLSLDWLMGLKDDRRVNNELNTCGDVAKLLIELTSLSDKKYNIHNDIREEHDTQTYDIRDGEVDNIDDDNDVRKEYNDNNFITINIKTDIDSILYKHMNVIEFVSNSNLFNDFYSEFCLMKDLINNKVINEEVFKLWIEKTVDKLDEYKLELVG